MICKTLNILTDNGIKGSINATGYIEIGDIKALKQPESIATLLVNYGLPPKMLNIFEEDLESYFLRIIGEKI